MLYAAIHVIIVWAVALAGISCMKKIQPEDKLYPVWAVFVSALFTLFVIQRVF